MTSLPIFDLIFFPVITPAGKSFIVIIEIACGFLFDLEISLVRLSKNNLGAGTPVKESDIPLFENSIFLLELTTVGFIRDHLLISIFEQQELIEHYELAALYAG